MKEHRRELVRLCRCAVARPRRQLVAAAVVSVWSLAWVVGQVLHRPSPLDVVASAARWAGVPVGWLEAVADWCGGRTGFLAVVGGLLWAVTTERRQGRALLGWVAVMLAAESVGYGAVRHALLALGGFLLVVVVLSLPGRRAFVVDRVALIPRDVLRAGSTALALAAVVPLVAPGLAVAGLLSPYVTRPPRPRAPITPVRADAAESAPSPAGTGSAASPAGAPRAAATTPPVHTPAPAFTPAAPAATAPLPRTPGDDSAHPLKTPRAETPAETPSAESGPRAGERAGRR
ncbi:hypothetical protein [Actinosynnema pretiosum]|uniref:hypothetical protein n=1 Tax=Actinosynnema pretiosum TaxID=42197 RepID=UPI001E5F3A25|nr:hypothetical protein [Actinosynnema pretiosum]